MRKFLKIAICMMIAVCLLSTVAFADASQSQTGEIIGPGGGSAEAQLDAPTAASLAGVPVDEIAVINPGQAAGPGDLTFKANGNDNGTIYVYKYVDGAWTLVGSASGSTFTLSGATAGTYGIAVSAKTSPKTGENLLPYVAIGIVIAAAAAAVVVSRKVKA